LIHYNWFLVNTAELRLC